MNKQNHNLVGSQYTAAAVHFDLNVHVLNSSENHFISKIEITTNKDGKEVSS